MDSEDLIFFSVILVISIVSGICISKAIDIYRRMIMKLKENVNGYEILPPSSLKLIGVSISLYFYLCCLKLFVENPEYTSQGLDKFLVWTMILCACVICVCMSPIVNNSRIYLFNMYLIYFIKCMLLLFIWRTYAFSYDHMRMMHRIALCLGYLFVLFEFLHAQTSNNFVMERYFFAGTTGGISCLVVLGIANFLIFELDFYLPDAFIVFMFYMLYMLRSFTYALRGKKTKPSTLFFICMMFFLAFSSMIIVVGGGMRPIFTLIGEHEYDFKLKDVMIIEILLMLGCSLLDTSKLKTKGVAYDGKHIEVTLPTFMVGISMLVLRCLFFAVLTIIAVLIWGAAL